MSRPETALLQALSAWQRGQLARDVLIGQFTALRPEQGQVVQHVIERLEPDPGRPPAEAVTPATGARTVETQATDTWRQELMACRARTWGFPASAGLLVGPSVLILTDGQRGVLLRPTGTRLLPGSTSASLMLLCQTIVLADHALDAQELGQLRQQRIESTSTSLSEIEIIR